MLCVNFMDTSKVDRAKDVTEEDLTQIFENLDKL